VDREKSLRPTVPTLMTISVYATFSLTLCHLLLIYAVPIPLLNISKVRQKQAIPSYTGRTEKKAGVTSITAVPYFSRHTDGGQITAITATRACHVIIRGTCRITDTELRPCCENVIPGNFGSICTTLPSKHYKK
jgi:hypothetical protein